MKRRSYKLIIQFVEHAWPPEMKDTVEVDTCGRVYLSRQTPKHFGLGRIKRVESTLEDALRLLIVGYKTDAWQESDYPEVWPKVILDRLERDTRTIQRMRRAGLRATGAALKYGANKSRTRVPHGTT